MSEEKNYAVDSDESDEDFCPENGDASGDSGAASEVDSSDIGEESEEEERTETPTKRGRGRPKVSKVIQSGQKKKSNRISEKDDCAATRTTRQGESKNGKDNNKSSREKDDLESDEEEKSHTDALWADFLSDVKPSPPSKKSEKPVEKPQKPPKSSSSSSKLTNGIKPPTNGDKPKSAASPNEDTVVIRKESSVTDDLADLASKETLAGKGGGANGNIPKKDGTPSSSQSRLDRRSGGPSPGGLKRAGMGSILNQIGKKKKVSLLEKSKHDWNSFKETEGIDEQLQTYNKGKDGFLERQDFLERTDLRQFEIERNLRQSRRKT